MINSSSRRGNDVSTVLKLAGLFGLGIACNVAAATLRLDPAFHRNSYPLVPVIFYFTLLLPRMLCVIDFDDNTNSLDYQHASEFVTGCIVGGMLWTPAVFVHAGWVAPAAGGLAMVGAVLAAAAAAALARLFLS